MSPALLAPLGAAYYERSRSSIPHRSYTSFCSYSWRIYGWVVSESFTASRHSPTRGIWISGWTSR